MGSLKAFAAPESNSSTNTLRVLRLETLIKLKESSNDPKDRQRLPILKETLKQLKP